MSERIPLARPRIEEIDIDAVREVLESGRLSQGRALAVFERSFAQYHGVPGAVGVSSGTGALMLVLDALGVRPGDEVITPSLTFSATANAIVRLGARPVFADVRADDLNLDPAVLRDLISPRTRAIIVVHLFGRMADVQAIGAIATDAGVAVVEDACQALGASSAEGRAGTLGDAAVFSFYANKPITTAEGGMIISSSEEVLTLCRLACNQGRDGDGAYRRSIAGFNFRLSELHAALGVSQMKRLPQMLADREAVARGYDELLSDVDALELPKLSAGRDRIAWFTYPLRLAERFSDPRDAIRQELYDAGIETGNYFPPVHQLPYYREFCPVDARRLAITERESRRLLSLPLHADLEPRQQERVAQRLRDALERLDRG